MPVYPEKVIDGVTYKETSDPNVMIESLVTTDDPDAPEITYRNMQSGRRWKQTGNCFSCGIADFDTGADGARFMVDPITMVDGKQLGEKYSVVDSTYETRKDHVCTPDYDADARANAIFLGVPYVCGLRFEELDPA